MLPLRSLVFILLSLSLARAQAPGSAAASKGRYQFDLDGSRQWIDSQLDLLAGARLSISASGSMQYQQGPAATPDGITRGWKDLLRTLPLNDSGRGALIGRIGGDEAAMPFPIGSAREVRATRAGRLFLGLNQPSSDTPTGSYHVVVEVVETGSASASAFVVDPVKALPPNIRGVDLALFGRLPRRVSDAQGNPGDMVNFLLLGTEDQVKRVFAQAGWVQVDKTKKGAVLHGLVATLSKESYVELPMSELYLFGRPQDYGMAHAEPLKVVSSRHHLRIWRAPFDVGARPLWVGAATHDIGFERDQRNNGLTHKIDPEIDGERKFVAESLSDTGMVVKLGYLRPPDALTEARTATGETFRSDGLVLILSLGDFPEK